MRKYIITIIFLVFLYNLNLNDINIYAENNNENCDIYTLIQENQESFELIDEHTGEMSKQRLLYCYVEGDHNTYFCMQMTIDSLAYMKEKSTYSLDIVNKDYFELYPFYCSVYDVIKK